MTAATPVARILLATDLTARADRALDRAVQLAKRWHSELHVVHAITSPAEDSARNLGEDWSWRRKPDRSAAIAKLIHQDIGDDSLRTFVHIDEGAAASVILAAAQRERCDLIVLGDSRDRMFPALIETTVERVVRKSPVSVLVAKTRPREAYRHLLVGTDFTDEARQALEVATRWFGDATFMLLHALTLAYASMAQGTGQAEESRATSLSTLRATVRDADIATELKPRIHVSVEEGPPAGALRRYVLDRGADLTVIGAHARGLLFDAVVGSSKGIIEGVPGDVLVVRARPAPASA